MSPSISATNTLQLPVEPRQTIIPLSDRRLADDEVTRACGVAQAVVAIGLGRGEPCLPGGEATGRAAAFARQIAMYLAHVGFGLSMAQVGKAFERDRTTVVHACHAIEDRRDEARFDAVLDHLEQAAVAIDAASRLNRQD